MIASVEKRVNKSFPAPRKACSLRAEIVERLWRKYEPGRGVETDVGFPSSPATAATVAQPHSPAVRRRAF